MKKKEREKVIACQIEKYYHNVADNPQGANLRLFMGKTSKQELANEQPVEMPRQDEFEEKNINQARRLDFEDYEQADRDEYHTNGTIATT